MTLEVKEALFQTNPLKSLGLNGLPALSYQKFWHIVGSDVTDMELDFLNNHKDLTPMNSTFITLIPKCKNPSSPK